LLTQAIWPVARQGLSDSAATQSSQQAWAEAVADNDAQWFYSHNLLYGVHDFTLMRLGVNHPLAVPPTAKISIPGKLMLFANRQRLLPESYVYGFAFTEMKSLQRDSFLLGKTPERKLETGPRRVLATSSGRARAIAEPGRTTRGKTNSAGRLPAAAGARQAEFGGQRLGNRNGILGPAGTGGPTRGPGCSADEHPVKAKRWGPRGACGRVGWSRRRRPTCYERGCAHS
jgi:hypothetical protein